MRILLVVLLAVLAASGYAAVATSPIALDQINAMETQLAQVLASGQPATVPVKLSNGQTISVVISRSANGKILVVPAPGQIAPFSTIVIALALNAQGKLAVSNLVASHTAGSVELAIAPDGKISEITRDPNGNILQTVALGERTQDDGLRGGSAGSAGLPSDTPVGGGINPGGDNSQVDGSGSNQQVSTTTP